MAVRTIVNRLQIIVRQACAAQKRFLILAEPAELFLQDGEGVGIPVQKLFALGNGKGSHGFIQKAVAFYIRVYISEPVLSQVAVLRLLLFIHPHDRVVLRI